MLEKEQLVRNQFSQYKILANWDRIEMIFNNKSPTPITVELNPSYACNFKCIHCYVADELTEKNDILMDNKILFDTTDAIARSNIRGVIISGGGEPLLHNEVSEVIYILNKNNKRIGLITNGTHLEKVTDAISQSKGFVRVSLDAYNEEIWRLIHLPRVKNLTFDLVLNNIKNLVNITRKRGEKNLLIGVSYIPLKKVENDLDYCNMDYEQLCIFINQLNNIGVDYIQFRTEFKKGKVLSDEELNKLEDFTKRLSKEFKNKNIVVINIGGREKNQEKEKSNLNKKSYQKCFISHLEPLLGADGTAYVCCQLQNKDYLEQCCFGTVTRDYSARELWLSPNRFKIADSIDVNKCPPCRFDKTNEFLDSVFRDKKQCVIIKGVIDIYKKIIPRHELSQIADDFNSLSKQKKLLWNLKDILTYLGSIEFDKNENERKDNCSYFLL